MPREIVDGVYDITIARDLGRLRAYLFDGKTPTLVDTTLSDHAGTLFEGIEETPIDPERLVITHEDPDHVGVFDDVVERYGVETWVPEAAEFEADHDPDHRFGDREQIGRFKTVAVPGHTQGSSALVDEDSGILIAGDALVGADWRGLPKGYLIPPPEGYTADLHAAERHLDRFLRYEFDVALVFHGSSVLEDADDKLDVFLNYPGRPD